MPDLADLLRTARLERGIGVRELARRIERSSTWIVHLESGQTTSLSWDSAELLAAALWLSPEEIYAATGRVSPDVADAVCARPEAMSRAVEALASLDNRQLSAVIQAAWHLHDGVDTACAELRFWARDLECVACGSTDDVERRPGHTVALCPACAEVVIRASS